MYLVVTGLTLRSPLYQPLFLYHAVRSYGQAQSHPGNIHHDQRMIGDVHHTLTLWDNAEASRAYGQSGHHRRAVAAFAKLATGKVYGGEVVERPDWPCAQTSLLDLQQLLATYW